MALSRVSQWLSLGSWNSLAELVILRLQIRVPLTTAELEASYKQSSLYADIQVGEPDLEISRRDVDEISGFRVDTLPDLELLITKANFVIFPNSSECSSWPWSPHRDCFRRFLQASVWRWADALFLAPRCREREAVGELRIG